MKKEMVEQIRENPHYQELIAKRTGFSIKLSIAMLTVYCIFILTIAFYPELLGTPLADGSVTTVGIPVGMGVILFAFILTGIYTKRANGEFDDLSNNVKQSLKEDV